MNFMKLSAAASVILAAVAFTACDDSSSADDKSYDCSVKGGVKVLYPEGGESFKIGDKIKVVYGSDVKGTGFRFVYKTSENDIGLDLLEASAGPAKPDGKTCYEQEVELSEEIAEPSKKAIIRVIPYENPQLGANSGAFKLTE